MAKRWTIPFVSLANKQCRIDIYDPGWSGDVTELSTANADAPGVPAADPFYYEEDDDEDLLKVVRIKTGYINLIEKTQDGLINLYPTSWNSRYVEVYYDSTLDFRGYIQQQSFENTFGPAPREVSLPVISVLGVIEMFDMDLPTSVPANDKPLGRYLKQLIDKIDSSEHTGYSRVVFPQVLNCPDFAGTIHPTVVNEENPSFKQEWFTNENSYRGISLRDFLEGICNAYNWICHDLPDCILFTMFEHADVGINPLKYYYYNINNLDTATNRQTIQDEYAYPLMLDNYMEPCSDDGVISQIMPLRSLTVQFQGGVTTDAKADYKHMLCSAITTYLHNGDEEYIAFFKNVNNTNYPDITGTHLLDSNTIYDYDNQIFLQNEGISVFDMNGTTRMVMKNIRNWASAGDTLCTLYFYKRPILVPGTNHTDLKLKIDVSTSDNLTDFGDNYIRYDITYLLYCGSQLIGSRTVQYRDNNNHMEFSFTDIPNTGTLKLVIRFDGEPDSNPYPLLSFDNIELFYEERSYKKYLTPSDVVNIQGNFTGTEDGEIKMLMSTGRTEDNTISNASNYILSYGYLYGEPQDRLQIRMRPKSGQSLSMLMSYINRIQYWKTAWRWRLIALAFHPWDDEWTLTMHHSSTID